MMQRADENGVVDGTVGTDCNDGLVQLSCLLDLPDCPEACQLDDGDDDDDDDTIFDQQAGTLNVSVGNALPNNSEIPMAGIVKFASVNFSASSDDIALATVEVENMGLANPPSGTRVWFERNGVRITGRATFTSDGTAIVSFAPAFVVKAGSTETLDLYVELPTA